MNTAFLLVDQKGELGWTNNDEKHLKAPLAYLNFNRQFKIKNQFIIFFCCKRREANEKKEEIYK